MVLSRQLHYAFRHLLKGAPPVEGRVQWLRAHEHDTPEQIHAAQERLLHRTLQQAARRIPAYSWLKGCVPQRGVHEFLRTLPIVDRPMLLAGRSLYYPYEGRPRPWHSLGRTSGTTGSPLELLRSYDSVLWEQAFWRQHWRWAGWQPGQTQAVVRGDVVVPAAQTEPPFWFDDPIGRQFMVSIRHLSKATVGPIVDALRERGPRLLRAYPSGASTLAALVADAGLTLHFDAVVTSSEMLLPEQRRLIEDTFSAKVYDHYGMAERVALGIECEHGRLHVHPYYSFVETVDERGRVTDDEGYVVGTTFHNLAMPLLRYRVTDRARWGRGTCACGRSYPHLEWIGGRYGDPLYDREGRSISPTLACYAFMNVARVAKAQVAQVGVGRLELRVVPMQGFDEADRENLVRKFMTLVSAGIDVQVNLCEDIAPEPNGKYKFVSQEFYTRGATPAQLNAVQLSGLDAVTRPDEVGAPL
jgi:phenylacetate-CoA ligase